MDIIGFILLVPFGFIFGVMLLVNTIIWIVEAYKRGWQEIQADLVLRADARSTSVEALATPKGTGHAPL